MSALGDVLMAVLQLFQAEFTIDGFTFSFWQIFLWSIVAGAFAIMIIWWVKEK